MFVWDNLNDDDELVECMTDKCTLMWLHVINVSILKSTFVGGERHMDKWNRDQDQQAQQLFY